MIIRVANITNTPLVRWKNQELTLEVKEMTVTHSELNGVIEEAHSTMKDATLKLKSTEILRNINDLAHVLHKRLAGVVSMKCWKLY